MQLKVIGSSSAGNGYVFRASDGESVILECGRPLALVKKFLDYKVGGIKGIFVTHEHGDHAGRCREYLDELNAPMFMSRGTWDAISEKTKSRRVPNIVKDRELVQCGRFGVMPVLLKTSNGNITHDAAEPMAYLVIHPEMGVTIFATDTYCIPFKVNQPNNVLIECNYEEAILEDRYERGEVDRKRRDRTIESHMSLDTCKKELRSMDLSRCRNVILLHLSNDNSDEQKFLNEIKYIQRGAIGAASDGNIYNMDLTPF